MKPTNPSRGQGFFAVRRAPLSHRETLPGEVTGPSWMSGPAGIERRSSTAHVGKGDQMEGTCRPCDSAGEVPACPVDPGRFACLASGGTVGAVRREFFGAQDRVSGVGEAGGIPDGLAEMPGGWLGAGCTDGDPAAKRFPRTRRRAWQRMMCAWLRPAAGRDGCAACYTAAQIFIKPNNTSNFRTSQDTMEAWPCKRRHAHESRDPTCREHPVTQWKQRMEPSGRASWRGVARARGCPKARPQRRTRCRAGRSRRGEAGPRCRVGWRRPCQEPRWAHSASPLAS